MEEGDELSGSFVFEVFEGIPGPVLLGRPALPLDEVSDLVTGLHGVLDFLHRVFAFDGRCLPQDLVRVRTVLNASAVRFHEGYMEGVMDSPALGQGQPDGSGGDDLGDSEGSQHLVVELLGWSSGSDVAGVEHDELVFDEQGRACSFGVRVLLHAGSSMFEVRGSTVKLLWTEYPIGHIDDATRVYALVYALQKLRACAGGLLAVVSTLCPWSIW
jgi:hypothetical protein